MIMGEIVVLNMTHPLKYQTLLREIFISQLGGFFSGQQKSHFSKFQIRKVFEKKETVMIWRDLWALTKKGPWKLCSFFDGLPLEMRPTFWQPLYPSNSVAFEKTHRDPGVLEHHHVHVFNVSGWPTCPGVVLGFSYRQIETIGIALGAFETWAQFFLGGREHPRGTHKKRDVICDGFWLQAIFWGDGF